MHNNVSFFNNHNLKETALNQLKKHWTSASLLTITLYVLTIIILFLPKIKFLFIFILIGPVELGLTSFFLDLKRSQHSKIELFIYGFKNFSYALELFVIKFMVILVNLLLLLVPGIVALLNYSMSFYILHDNPSLCPREILKQSKELIYGYRLNLLRLYLSFIGWTIVSILTFGVGFIWLIPYIKTTTANFYDQLRRNKYFSIYS